MRLLCIDANPWPTSRHPEVLKLIKEGVEYELDYATIGLNRLNEIGDIYYLKGIKSYPDGFSCKRFIPLSEIDERELVNTKEECV